ncbi:heat shock 70 kDa protein, mitochondrial precursor, partial [Trypanosoma cruzi]
TGKTQNITITASGGLSKEQIERMIRDSESHAESDRLKRELVEVRNNAETQANTAERQLTEWKYVSDAEKENVRTLLAELRKSMENPNVTKDELSAATDKLQKAVMECGRTEYQQAAAANSSSSSGNTDSSQGEQQQKGDQQKQ